MIATQLTDVAIRDLKEMFLSMDENNDGTLSIEELKDRLSFYNLYDFQTST